MSTQINGISSMATRQVLADLVANFQRQTGQSVHIESVGGVDAAKRVQAGEAFDVVILASDAIDKLIASGHVAGATLDVFRTEPLPADHVFWQHPKITVTPHTSARTLREESIAQIVGKMQALQRGEPINGVVYHQRGY